MKPPPAIIQWMSNRCATVERLISREVPAPVLLTTALSLIQRCRKGVPPRRLASACIWIAVKYHCDTLYPCVYTVRRHARWRANRRRLLQAEVSVLQQVNWRVCSTGSPTATDLPTMLPTLFLITKLGRNKLWRIQVEGNTLVRQDYLVGGKEKLPTRRQCSATNVGRANQRTAEEQAWFEAARCWIKQVDKGYQPAPDDTSGCAIYQHISTLKQGGLTNHNLPIILLQLCRGETPTQDTVPDPHAVACVKPMLADKLQAKERHFQPDKELWYVQPKLDGVRCMARLINGEVHLLSRTGKALAHLQHVKQALLSILTEPDTILDGELYTDSLCVNGDKLAANERFDKISGACRPVRGEPAPYEQQIQYHVFDVVRDEPQQQRLEWLKGLDSLGSSTVVVVETHPVATRADVDSWQARFLHQGYEGVILRRGSARYEHRRSVSLLKYKQFDDAEFLIVGASDAGGTEQGCVIWRCQTEQGSLFDVRPRGSFQQRQRLFQKRDRLLGKLLTVRYQGVSSDGVPRFPVGVAIRDYE